MSAEPKYISVNRAGRLKWLPTPVSGRTVRRWAKFGINGVRLLVIRIGGKGLHTTSEWMREFFQQSAQRSGENSRPTAQSARAEKSIKRELEKIGL